LPEVFCKAKNFQAQKWQDAIFGPRKGLKRNKIAVCPGANCVFIGAESPVFCGSGRKKCARIIRKNYGTVAVQVYYCRG
jgi:hypothetical protein